MIADVNLDESEALQARADEKEAEAARLLREADDLRKQIKTIKAAGEKKEAADTAAGEIAKMEGEYDELKVARGLKPGLQIGRVAAADIPLNSFFLSPSPSGSGDQLKAVPH